jgi:hypothetical protein
MLYLIRVNNFFDLIEKLCFLAKIKNTKSVFSKQMYGNIKLTFLVAYKEKLNVSYRRFVEICDENNIQRMLCIKQIPHFTTLQKFVQRTPKQLFNKLVRACRKLLKLKDVTAAIDGTGFSNTNPSHHYIKRIDSKNPVKNYTKTVFLADINNNIILDVRTTSGYENETKTFKPMVKQLATCLKTIVADKGYDSMSNRKLCWDNGIDVHIPFRQWSASRKQCWGTPSKRKTAERKFDKTTYNQRSNIESLNSAVKQTLGGFVRARSAGNQQKNVVIKALTYNIEQINRKIKIVLFIEFQ